MTLNGLKTPDECHLCGSRFFIWPLQFGRKLVLGTTCRWPRPKRDIDTSRHRLSSFECLSPKYCALQQHLCCCCCFCCLRQWLTDSVYTVTVTINHSCSQDFVWECTFLPPQKLTTFFSRRSQNTRWNCLNSLSHRPNLPSFLKNWTFALPRGCIFCLGVHLQISHVNLPPPPFFSQPWGSARAPSAPPGYAYAISYIIWVQ